MKRFSAALVLAVALLAAPSFAAEEPKEEGKKESPIKEVSILWKWANFAILAGALGYLSSKQIAPLLQKRSEEITAGLAAGEQAKAAAEAEARAVDARLANLGTEIVKLQNEAKEAREREATRLQRETAVELERIARQAQVDLDSAAKQSALEVRSYAAVKALELAEAKVKAGMTPTVQAALINNFVKKVASGSEPAEARN